jgi:hypothetical protein
MGSAASSDGKDKEEMVEEVRDLILILFVFFVLLWLTPSQNIHPCGGDSRCNQEVAFCFNIKRGH